MSDTKDAEIARLRADIARKDAALREIAKGHCICDRADLARAALAPSAERDAGGAKIVLKGRPVEQTFASPTAPERGAGEAAGEIDYASVLLGMANDGDGYLAQHDISRLRAAARQIAELRANLLASPSAPERDAGMVLRALQGMVDEWDKLTRYGSPLAKAANERVAFAREVLAAAKEPRT